MARKRRKSLARRQLSAAAIQKHLAKNGVSNNRKINCGAGAA